MKKIILIFLMLNFIHTYISTAEPINLNISFKELNEILEERNKQFQELCQQIEENQKNMEEALQKNQDDLQMWRQKQGISHEDLNAIREYQKDNDESAAKILHMRSLLVRQIEIESQKHAQENLELILKWKAIKKI